MKRPFFSRTRPWPGSERGSVTVIVLLLLVVFAGLGLAMLHASAAHVSINGFRRFSTLLDGASENGLKRGLRDITARLEERGLLASVSAAAVEAVRADPRRGFAPLVEEALGPVFPRIVDESFDGLSWTSRTDCAFGGLEDLGGYLRLEAFLSVESTGRLARVRARRLSTLEGRLGFLAGRLPLAAVPFYIKGDWGAGERAAFAAEHGIRLAAKPGQPLGAAMTSAPGGVLPEDAGALAAKALAVGVFEPGGLSPAQLRQALSLEPSTDPVPDGVYLIENDLGLGGVFVQGSLDELVLAVRGDTQIVVFRSGDSEWRLEWSPARSRTDFLTPEGARAYELVPLPLLFINGAVASLGGGAVSLDGRVEMSLDDRTPAVLDGVDLTIVSADRITISTHLVLEGVRWRDGVPYSRGTEAQLVIYSSGRDVVTGEATAGGLAVAAGAPADLKLQASLTAAAGGFRIEDDGKSVELLGALHADAYEDGGSRLTLYRDERVDDGLWPHNGPLTAEAHLAVYALKVLAWREY